MLYQNSFNFIQQEHQHTSKNREEVCLFSSGNYLTVWPRGSGNNATNTYEYLEKRCGTNKSHGEKIEGNIEKQDEGSEVLWKR